MLKHELMVKVVGRRLRGFLQLYRLDNRVQGSNLCRKKWGLDDERLYRYIHIPLSTP